MAKATTKSTEQTPAAVMGGAAAPAPAASVPAVVSAVPQNLIVSSETYPVLGMSVAELTELIQANVGTQQGAIGKFDLPRLKVPGAGATSWNIETFLGRQTLPYLDVIFLYWRDGRTYWEQEYGSGPKSPPDCKSEDGVTGTGHPGGICATCPLSQFDDDAQSMKDKKPKCQRKRLSFVLVNGELMPWTFFIPLMSIDPFKKYLLRLISARKPFWQVVTRIELEPASNSGGIEYAKLKPSVAGILDAEQVKTMAAYIKNMSGVFAAVQMDAEREGGEPVPQEVG